MGEPIQPVDHNDLQELLLEQFRWRTDGTASRITQMIGMLAAEMNLAEDALQELLTAFDVTTAVGAQLDILGSIFGAARAGMGDEDYRAAIRGAALTALSGTPEQLIAAIRTIIGGTDPIRLYEVQPATAYLYLDTGRIPGITVSQIAAKAKPAGVQLVFADFLCADDFQLMETDDGQLILVED